MREEGGGVEWIVREYVSNSSAEAVTRRTSGFPTWRTFPDVKLLCQVHLHTFLWEIIAAIIAHATGRVRSIYDHIIVGDPRTKQTSRLEVLEQYTIE